MVKQLALTLAIGFAFYMAIQFIRRAKNKVTGTIPTGVSRITYFLVVLFLFVGPFVLVIGSTKLFDQIQVQLDWVSAKGFVTEHVEAGKYKGRTTYQARFHYRTSEETGSVDHEVLNAEAQTRPPEVSKAVDVLYNPSNPDQAMIDDAFGRWGASFALTIAGIFLIFFAGGAVLQILRIQRSEKVSRGGTAIARAEGRFLSSKKSFFLSLRHSAAWILSVEYQDMSGRKYVIQSEPIWQFDPKKWAKSETPVPIMINRMNPAEAWVLVQEYYTACEKTGGRA